MDYDYGTQDTYESSSYSHDNYTNQENAFGDDRSNNYSFTKGNDYSPSSEQEKVVFGLSSAPDDLTNPANLPSESQEIVDQEEIKDSEITLNNLESENIDPLENIPENIPFNEGNQDANMSDMILPGKKEQTDDDNDCCSCSNTPLTCLAFFCDCFGI